jgi:ABC-type branched-subunit amino acid transport system substrate-binding protein
MLRPVVVVVAALAAAGGLAACHGSPGQPAPTSLSPTTPTTPRPSRGNVDGTLTIGVLLPETGDAAPIGAPMIAAVQLAVQQINAFGGVNGRPVRLVERDESNDPNMAAVALDELINVEGIDALIGPASSKVALALLDRTVEAGVLTCSPANTAIALTDFPHDGLYFRTMPSDALQAIALGQAIAATGRRSTAIIYPDDDYGRSLQVALHAELSRQDVDVTAATPYNRSAISFGSVVDATMSGKPESIAVLGLAGPGGRILAALQDAQVLPSRVPTFVTDGMRRADLFEQVDAGRPRAVQGIEGTSPAAVPTGAKWFTDAFEGFSNGASIAYAAYAYDCTNLVALSALVAGSDDATAMAAQMVPTSRSGTVCRNFVECAPLILEERNVDLDGASGAIELTAGGDTSVGIFDVFEFDGTGRDELTRQVSVAAR